MNIPTSASTKVALIGLGLMGAGMASRLIRAGFTVAVFNRDPARAAPFAPAARVAGSAREAAEGAAVILSMVADDHASRSVWLGEQGALNGAPSGAVCIESSTVTPEWIREWAAAVAAKECAALDAPVTGSRAQAESGELNFMVGGSAAALAKAQPVLAAMSKSITPLGPVGSGAVFKLINNFMCGVQLASLAEAMTMIDRSGLDRATAVALLANGAPGSPLVKAVSARMLAADESLNFRVRLMAKDLHYAAREAASLSLDLASATTAHATFTGAVEAGFGEHDISAVYQFVRGDRGSDASN
jgi:3-hydroxyisobutyrate dehydrogenase